MDTQNCHISEVKLEDLEDIQTLAGVIWRAHYPGIISYSQIDFMLAADYTPEALSEALKQGVAMRKLLVDDHLVGFSAFGPLDSEGLLKLHKLYLLPSFHGRGLGSMLLTNVEREASKLGANTLVLQVNKHNSHAIRAYRATGFKVHRSLVSAIGGGFFMDDFEMQKPLNAQESANGQLL